MHYINLDADTEKRRNIERQFLDLNVKNLTRHPGVEVRDKKKGVAMAHRQLLRELSDFTEPFLVVEDDVSVWNWRTTVSFPDGWDAVYLGVSRFGEKGGIGRKGVAAERVTEEFWRIHNMLSAHAVLFLNPRYAEWVAKTIEVALRLGIHQDLVRAQTMKYWKIGALERPIFYQTGQEKATKRPLSQLHQVSLISGF